jgi:hypothetical protein
MGAAVASRTAVTGRLSRRPCAAIIRKEISYMKNTAEESADLKIALKHKPWTPELEAEAKDFPLEADEAYFEVVDGWDTCTPDSWVAREIAAAKIEAALKERDNEQDD